MHEINIAQKCFFSKRCQVFVVQTSLPCYYGPPTTKTKPTSILSIFVMILSYFKIKIKKKCMDNGCLVSKHDSPQRISDFCRRLESKASALKASQDLVKNSRFLIFKNQTFNKGNKAT